MDETEIEQNFCDTLGGIRDFNCAFGEVFLERYGSYPWLVRDADVVAAHNFRVQLISRVATQKLTYGAGVEEVALESIHKLFDYARDATAANPGCRIFEIFVWHVLNIKVRPFTAKWHQQAKLGSLVALDASDNFREELETLQRQLRVLDAVLIRILSKMGYEPDPEAPEVLAPEVDISADLRWCPAGETRSPDQQSDFAWREERAIEMRRETYGIASRDWAAGLALSGGGIRSATFALGVVKALARRGILPDFDYLSTVSGGGYTGGFLTNLLGGRDVATEAGLRAADQPFRGGGKESTLLMGLRQRSRYLSAGLWERIVLAMRATSGVFVNIALVLTAVVLFGAFDALSREFVPSGWEPILAMLPPVIALLLLRFYAAEPPWLGWRLTVSQVGLGLLFAVPPLWFMLGLIHEGILDLALLPKLMSEVSVSASLTLFVLLGSFAAVLAALSAQSIRRQPTVMAVATIAILVLIETFVVMVYHDLELGFWIIPLVLVAGMVMLSTFVDINATSLHGYYRAKIAAAFLGVSRNDEVMKLSEFDPRRAMFPIINCALNVPSSKNPAMRGRLCDVFSFTPAAAGSRVTDFFPLEFWEQANPNFDLASMMAVSGAAVSPQMGLQTNRFGSFWMSLLNVRLGAWVQKPGIQSIALPFRYLFREFLASADEQLQYLNLSDGGHIENLGVYELLRRRCQFIVAIDGENDPAMTFHALTNLQRLAYIDFGIQIDAELDDLRLGSGGLSRSHFRFCRIDYPSTETGEEAGVGYLLYIKLSLTGNEGEFLRRYKLDEPTFPHHTTANQFFTETQFEAYRSLGEHVGDKLFMKAIVGDQPTPISLETFMTSYRRSFL